MKLQQFLEKFLPEITMKFLVKNSAPLSPAECDLRAYFPEALQNYTDRICKRQRENCADNLENGVGYTDDCLYAEQEL